LAQVPRPSPHFVPQPLLAMAAFGAAKGFKVARATGPYQSPATAAAAPGGHPDDGARMVYVGNLSFKLRWQELKDHFKQIGQVENARILTEDGTDGGRSRGVGFVRFKTEAEAELAIARLNGSELDGRFMVVDAWTGGGAGRGAQERMERRAATTTLALPAGGKGKGGGRGTGGGTGAPRMNEVRGENLVYVGNLTYEVRWQDLKDHMKQAGTVEFCNVLTEDGTEFGRSRGTGCVRYSNAAEVQQAIAMLGESELMGRKILVDHWTGGGAGGKK